MDRNICEDGTIDYLKDPKNNYCRYAWHEETNDNNYGPDTAMKKLYNATKNWNYIDDMVMNYEDEENKGNVCGYDRIITENGETKIIGEKGSGSRAKENIPITIIGSQKEPLKTRLPQVKEMLELKCTSSSESCPSWIVDNLKYYDITNNKYINNKGTNENKYIEGYWLLSSNGGSYNHGKNIYYKGNINGIYTSTTTAYGIRPVITMSKTNLIK